MELWTMNNVFRVTKHVENYESLIWTERYGGFGDFELISANIEEAINLLPRESYVTLKDSRYVMIVEDHKLVKPLRDKPQVTITGRTFDSVLERRASINGVGAVIPTDSERAPWMIQAASSSDAAYLTMRIVLGDLQQTATDGTVLLPGVNAAVSNLDGIAELKLIRPADYIDAIPEHAPVYDPTLAYTTGAKVTYANYLWRALGSVGAGIYPGDAPASWQNVSPVGKFEIKMQNLYGTVAELISLNHHGIKATRVDGQPRVNLEIYNGADLTSSYLVDARFDQIDAATYLLSQRGSATTAYVFGPHGSQQVNKTTVERAGLNRRVIVVDSSTDTDSDNADVRRTRGLIELYKYNATALFDGEVASQVAAGYNKDYFLGDIIKLVGEYGLSQNVRVAEFIRSSSAQGEKYYPTFEAVDE